MPSPSERKPLPFEPKKNKEKVIKKPPTTSKNDQKKEPIATKAKKNSKQDASLRSIPEEVSRRMVRRMAIFSGIPTGLGISSFFVFYLVVSQDWFKVPNTAVLLVSFGLFGLGVLGLSYGILSTSWDEGRVGSWWGAEEFSTNLGRMTSAWRQARQEARKKKADNSLRSDE